MAMPESQNYFTDNEDLIWHLKNSVDWERIVGLTEANFTLKDGPENLEEAKELYMDIMEEVGRFVAKEIAPRAEKLDAKSPRLVDGEVKVSEEMQEIFEGLKEMGLFGLSVPRELGGMNCPLVLYFTLGEVMARADCGTMTHFSFFGGIAMALLVYAAREGHLKIENGQFVSTRFQDEIEEIVSGEAWGAMVLTEPDAGSDLAKIRTTGKKDENGLWRLTGEKIFITSGHAQHQVVLARTKDDKSLKGLSIFLCPRIIERDGETIQNIKITKVEKKVGHNSSPTCSLLYENSEAQLIGKEGQGFELMLVLMNNARVAVGFEGIGVCEAAFRMATHYASQRETMGKFLKDHELIADRLQQMDTELKGMRALAFEALNAVEISHRSEMTLKHNPPKDEAEKKAMEKRVKYLKRKSRELTPLLKYITSENAVAFARENMQIHGGMGYITETGADRLLRDALVLPVYEGTSQIQALMALKDHLGYVIQDPAGFVKKAMRARVNVQVNRGVDKAFHQAEVKVYQSIEAIIGRIFSSKVKNEWTGKLKTGSLLGRLNYLRSQFLRNWDPKEDFAHGMVHAERLCKILCDVNIARILLKQGRQHPERMIYAKRYVMRMLPRVTALAMEIQMGNDLDALVSLEEEKVA
jgi:3-(methylthio)propanoyl-CoA dehydrogenase